MSLQDWANKSHPVNRGHLDGFRLLNDNLTDQQVQGVFEDSFDVFVKGCGGGCLSMGWKPLLLLFAVFSFGFPGQGEIIMFLLGIGLVFFLLILFFNWLKTTPVKRESKADFSPLTQVELDDLQASEITDSEDVEKLAVHARQIVQRTRQDLNTPYKWYLAPGPIPRALTIGNTLVVTLKALDSPYLGAMLAHELYRLNHGDGRIKLALNRWGVPPGERHNQMEWRSFWRQQVFAADKFAGECGYAQEMVEYLQSVQSAEIFLNPSKEQEPLIHERLNQLKRLGA